MDILEEARNVNRKSFLSHVFSTTEEGKAELLNVSQYACLGVIPIVMLNKLIQRFIPEADHEKSSVEITIEVFLQIFGLHHFEYPLTIVMYSLHLKQLLQLPSKFLGQMKTLGLQQEALCLTEKIVS